MFEFSYYKQKQKINLTDLSENLNKIKRYVPIFETSQTRTRGKNSESYSNLVQSFFFYGSQIMRTVGERSTRLRCDHPEG